MSSFDAERKAIRSAAERNYGRAYDLSHRIHANPELAFEEVKAADWLAGVVVQYEDRALRFQWIQDPPRPRQEICPG